MPVAPVADAACEDSPNHLLDLGVGPDVDRGGALVHHQHLDSHAATSPQYIEGLSKKKLGAFNKIAAHL